MYVNITLKIAGDAPVEVNLEMDPAEALSLRKGDLIEVEHKGADFSGEITSVGKPLVVKTVDRNGAPFMHKIERLLVAVYVTSQVGTVRG